LPFIGKSAKPMPCYPASLLDSGINRPPIPATQKSGRFNPGFSGRFIPVSVADLSRIARPIYRGIRNTLNYIEKFPLTEAMPIFVLVIDA